MKKITAGTTGETLITNFNINADAVGIDENGLPSMVLSLGGTRSTIVIDSPQAITENLIVPSNISIIVKRSGLITVTPGKTITINGTFEAGLYQVFAISTASQLIFRKGATKEIFPEWFTDNTAPGVTDMTVALKLSMSIYSDVTLSRNNYLITDTIFFNKGNVLRGQNNYPARPGGLSIPLTLITFAPTTEKDLFDLVTNVFTDGYLSGVSISGISLVGNSTGGSNFSRYAINTRAIQSVFENIGIDKFQDGIFLSGTIGNKYRDIIIYRMTHAGIYADSLIYSLGEIFDKVWIDSCPWGAILTSGVEFRFLNCLWETLSTGGINLYRGTSASFVDNYAEDVLCTSLADNFAMFYCGHDGPEKSTSVTITGGYYGGVNLSSTKHGSFFDIGYSKSNVAQSRITNVTFARFVNGFKVDPINTDDYAVSVFGINWQEVANPYLNNEITVKGGYRIHGQLNDVASGTNNNTTLITQYVRAKRLMLSDSNGTGTITQAILKTTLNNNASYQIDIFAANNMIVIISANDGNAITEGGIFSISYNTLTNVAIVAKLSGSSNVSAINEPGKLCFVAGPYNVASGAAILINKLGVAVNINIIKYL